MDDYEGYLPADPDMKRITHAFETVGYERLRPVHDALGGEVAYWKLRLARAHFRRQFAIDN